MLLIVNSSNKLYLNTAWRLPGYWDQAAGVVVFPRLLLDECARQLGVNENTLHTWLRKAKEGKEFRGQGNYSSDQAKEIAHLKRELKNARDALNILKNVKDHKQVAEEMFETVYQRSILTLIAA